MTTFKTTLFEANDNARTYVRDNLLKELSKKGIKLNDKEYAQLVKYLITKNTQHKLQKILKLVTKLFKLKL